MSVWQGFGVNYKAQQSNWSADMAYFNSIGLTNIRPHMPGTPHPWNSATNALWRTAAQTFHNAGFWVTWGTSQSPITNSNWQAYHDSVVAEALYLQQQNIVIDEYEIGNELESAINMSISSLTQSGGIATCTTSSTHGFITGESVTIYGASPSGYNGTFTITKTGATTFTYSVSSSLSTPATGTIHCYSLSIAQLNANLRQLATDVKAVFNLGQVSYACWNNTVNGASTFTDWIVNGLGGLDTISIHPYGNINTSTQTVGGGNFPDIPSMVQAFGNKCYVSEFNLDASSTNLNGLNTGTSVAFMQHFYSDYILKYLQPINSKALLYMWSGYLNQDNNFAAQLTTGSLIQPWGVFLNTGGHAPRSFPSSRNASSSRQATIQARGSMLFIGNNTASWIIPANTSILQVGASSDYTVGARVKIVPKTQGNDNDSHTIANCDFNFNTNLGYTFEINPSDGKANVWVGNTNYKSPAYLIQYGVWQSVVFRITGTALDMFVQGSKVWTQTIVRRATANGATSRFGTENSGTGSAQRRIWGNAREFFAVQSSLTDAQVQAIALNGVYPAVGILYNLDEGSGTTANDSSGNANTGTITGANWSSDANTATRTNLIGSPSFESSSGWSTGSSGTLTGLANNLQDTTYTLYGTHAGQLQANSSGQYYLDRASVFTPVQGTIYTFSAYVYIPVGSLIVQIGIGIRDFSSFNYVPYPNGNTGEIFFTLTPGQWTRISYTAVGGAGGYPTWRFTIADPHDSNNGSASFTTPQSWWVDGAMLEASSSPGTYFDGSNNGGSWTGTVNASTSILPVQRYSANNRSSIA